LIASLNPSFTAKNEIKATKKSKARVETVKVPIKVLRPDLIPGLTREEKNLLAKTVVTIDPKLFSLEPFEEKTIQLISQRVDYLEH
jgi:hypothetical protein